MGGRGDAWGEKREERDACQDNVLTVLCEPRFLATVHAKFGRQKRVHDPGTKGSDDIIYSLPVYLSILSPSRFLPCHIRAGNCSLFCLIRSSSSSSSQHYSMTGIPSLAMFLVNNSLVLILNRASKLTED